MFLLAKKQYLNSLAKSFYLVNTYGIFFKKNGYRCSKSMKITRIQWAVHFLRYFINYI